MRGWCKGCVVICIVCTAPDLSRKRGTFMTEQHIAVVDDAPDITRLLANYLGGNGFRVTECSGGTALMALMRTDPPDLVLLDVGLPGDDGLVIARRLREHWQTSIILVTGRSEPVDKVVGLEIGADDYITKPFDLRELLARVKAVLRRSSQNLHPSGQLGNDAAPPADRLHFAGWVLDLSLIHISEPTR